MVDVRRVLCTTAIIAAVLVSGTTFGLSAARAGDPVEQRQEEMKKLGKSIKALVAFTKNQGVTLAEVGDHAKAIHQASLTLTELFPAGTAVGVGESAAKPEIWSDWAHFQQAAAALTKESATLVQLAAGANTDPVKLRDQIGAVGKACGGCHETYRAKKS